MKYKFYRAQVTGGGYMPQGECLADLSLSEEREPTWTNMDPEFERLCLPWFKSTTRLGKMEDLDPLKPYSEEALEHLSKHQLPSQGFVMVKVKDAPAAPTPYGFHAPFFVPPPPQKK